MNREEWLTYVANTKVWPLLQTAGATIPPRWRVSVGFPKGARGGNKTIGQCWSELASADKHREIFISPILTASPAVEVLVHEAIHAALPDGTGHKGPFKRIAVAAGLTGKMTATVATPELARQIREWLVELPEYPHAAMTVAVRGSKGSRLVKCQCPDCGYTVRTTQKWIAVALPACPNGDCLNFEREMIVSGRGEDE